MSVDILGTNCDQCRSTVQCCFTSTETVKLIRTESPALDFDTAPELGQAVVELCLAKSCTGTGAHALLVCVSS